MPWWVKFLWACSRQCKKTKQKQQFTYGQYIFTDCTEDNVQNTHTCTIKTYLIINYTLYTVWAHLHYVHYNTCFLIKKIEPLTLSSLSGMETVVQQTARPSSGQWTPLQKSLVPLSPPSWTFSILDILHDAPAKQKVSWRTPPTPPTVSSSSYPQVDGTGVSEPAPPDCSTAFSPRLWEPWTHITQPLSETPNISWKNC